MPNKQAARRLRRAITKAERLGDPVMRTQRELMRNRGFRQVLADGLKARKEKDDGNLTGQNGSRP